METGSVSDLLTAPPNEWPVTSIVGRSHTYTRLPHPRRSSVPHAFGTSCLSKLLTLIPDPLGKPMVTKASITQLRKLSHSLGCRDEIVKQMTLQRKLWKHGDFEGAAVKNPSWTSCPLMSAKKSVSMSHGEIVVPFNLQPARFTTSVPISKILPDSEILGTVTVISKTEKDENLCKTAGKELCCILE